jgi:2-oxoglutarate dehydrogenase E2 component (dihydrolipoamide succinyltransferase)
MPSARKLMSERGVEPAQVSGSGKGGRVLKEDVLKVIESRPAAAVAEKRPTAPERSVAPEPRPVVPVSLPTPSPSLPPEARPEKRVPMTRLRARIAERLVEAQRSAAMLTTFNEVNMSAVSELRERYRERFEKQYGVRLGFMSFFVKACIEALRRFPEVNASIDGNDIVYHGFYDIGIAVSSPRGLVVPILRDADQMDMATIEARIREFGQKAKDGKLTLEEITGGTFSITNGGVFGSLLSTPILNPPQSAILGMHKIEERPLAENGQVVVRPMMYLALSYDHRIVDGREAVQFLVTIKDVLEDPARMLMGI